MTPEERDEPFHLGVCLVVAALLPFHELLSQRLPIAGAWDELLLLLVTGCLALRAVRSRRLPSPALVWPWLAFTAAVALSAWANGVPLWPALGGLRSVAPYAAAALAAAQLTSWAAAMRLGRGLAYGAVLIAVYGVLSFVTFRAVGGPDDFPAGPRNAWETLTLWPYHCGTYPVPDGWRLISSVLNDNYCGDWLAMLLPLTMATIGQGRGLAARWAPMVLMVALAWTYSRAAFAALAASLAIYAWLGDRRCLRQWIPFVVALPVFLREQDLYRYAHPVETSGGRLEAIAQAIEGLGVSPLFGVGTGVSGVMDVQYARILWQSGLLGALAFAWLLVAAFAPARRLRRLPEAPRRLAAALLAGMAAMGVASLGGDTWEIPQLALVFWLLAGLLHAVVSVNAPTCGQGLPVMNEPLAAPAPPSREGD